MANTSDSMRKAINKYNREKRDNIQIRAPKGTREIYKTYTAKAHLSLAKFIMTAVEEKAERDGLKNN